MMARAEKHWQLLHEQVWGELKRCVTQTVQILTVSWQATTSVDGVCECPMVRALRAQLSTIKITKASDKDGQRLRAYGQWSIRRKQCIDVTMVQEE